MQDFETIERRRAAAGIQQKLLAERASMNAQDYSRLKRPSRQGPTERTLRRLTKALDALIEEREARN